MELDQSRTELLHSLICTACKELLFEPVTLPCGNSICLRCFRYPKSIPESEEFSILAYKCPVQTCLQTHQYRYECMNFLLHKLLVQLFPPQQEALALNKIGEGKLSVYRFPRSPRSENAVEDKEKDLAAIIEMYFDKAIKLAPCLQLPYISRAKALAEMNYFDRAIEDARYAHKVNHINKRGKAIEKLVEWKRKMQHEAGSSTSSQLRPILLTQTILSKNSLNNLRVTDSVKVAVKELRKDFLDVLAVEELDEWSESSVIFLNSMKTQDFNLNELECQICLSTLESPITTPCGHSLCSKCLFDLLSQSKSCAFCRARLPSVGYFMKRPCDHALQAILKFYGKESTLSSKSKKMIFAPKKIPIFIHSLMFPTSKEGFHFFETRYRVCPRFNVQIMIKRCLEESREFGILLPNCTQEGQGGVCVEYGTVVKIDQSEALLNADFVGTEKDGDLPRFVLQTSGMYRFKVISVERNDAGFFEGMIQRIEDLEPEDETNDWDPFKLISLCSEARDFVVSTMASLPAAARGHYERKHGAMPDDPTDFSFWFAEFLPVNPFVIYPIMAMNTVCDRLEHLCSLIRDVNPI